MWNSGAIPLGNSDLHILLDLELDPHKFEIEVYSMSYIHSCYILSALLKIYRFDFVVCSLIFAIDNNSNVNVKGLSGQYWGPLAVVRI